MYIIMFILIFSFLIFHLCHAAIFDIVNQCPYTIWPAIIPGGGRELLPGQNWTIFINPRMDDARIWARTGCTFNKSGHGQCETGDCNGLLECQIYGSPPNTLAEFTLNGFNNLDFISISLVEGFNIPIEFSPTAGCNHAIQCSTNIIGQCPDVLKTAGGCNNPCTVFKTDEYCCKSGNCKPTSYSNFFKGLCPNAYSYPMDDESSTFTCIGGTDYRVAFCPDNNVTIPPSSSGYSNHDFVNAHNSARSQVGVGPVTWDDTMAAYAESYTNQRANDCTLIHSNGPYGENLFGGFGADYIATDAVNAWVSEGQDYDYNSNTCAQGKVCGHYTQVVWKSTTSIGCARVVCNNGGIFITCNYNPAGNVNGERPY